MYKTKSEVLFTLDALEYNDVSVGLAVSAGVHTTQVMTTREAMYAWERRLHGNSVPS